MRRALVLGLVALVVAIWFALRPTNETWVVAFSVDGGLSYDDPCVPSAEVIGGYATGPVPVGGLWVVGSRSDGEVVASCYEAEGGTADVHQADAGERDRLEEERRHQEDG